ncbi:MAG: LolA-like outer membrane lipoprotein chaperone [Campylobacterota bacterium]
MFYKIVLFVISLTLVSFASLDIENLDNFKSDFTQKIESSNKKEILYEGKLFIRKDGKVLWQYKTPIIKNVYISNNYVIVDEPDLEQAIYTTLKDEINIAKLLKKAKKVKQNLYVANYQDTKYKITTNDNQIISKIEYKDKLDNSVTINFKNIKTNIEIQDSVFKFVAPDYYDIIRK